MSALLLANVPFSARAAAETISRPRGTLPAPPSDEYAEMPIALGLTAEAAASGFRLPDADRDAAERHLPRHRPWSREERTPEAAGGPA